VETGDTDSFEWRRENHLIEVTATDDDDDGLTFLITFADVTDTRQMEQIQQQAWNYLEQILADITLGVAVLDAGLRITFVNDAGLRERFPLAEGDELALDVAAHPLHDRRGQSLGAILVIEDVTEKARLEDEVIRMERLATVGQMVITVNHEINNPLAIITTNAQAARLLNRDLNEKTVAKLLMIEAQVKRISEVTERLRTMEQVESDDYITDSPKMINIHNREDDHD
jgi:C4-dicarboxylate-specific signal transduction histidine kinase